MTKKLLSILLCAVLLVSLFAGCGNSTPAVDEETKAPAADGSVDEKNAKHLEISIGYWDVESYLVDDDLLTFMEEKFNVDFVPVNMTWEDYGQKLQVWAASDSLPDLFACDIRNSTSFLEWANQGLLKEIPADLSAYPNLAAYMDSPMTDTCQVNGKTYAIFRQTYLEQAEVVRDRSIVYRWDLAQAAGITEEPTNWDEFRAMIQAIIEADPEGKNVQGITTTMTDLPIGIFFSYNNPLATQSGSTFYWVDNGDGTYVPAYFAGENLGDNMLPVWNLIRDMYEEGTIEPDFALASYDTGYAKFLNGQAAALMANGYCGSYGDVGRYWTDVNDSNYLDAVRCLDFMPSVDGNKYHWMWSYAWSENCISSHVDDEKLDRILQIFDYLLSEEGVLLSRLGVEGETYIANEDGTFSNIEGVNPGDVYPSLNVWHDLVSWRPGMMDEGRFPLVFTDPIYVEMYSMEQERVAEARTFVQPEYDYRYTQLFNSLNTGFGVDLTTDMLTIMTGERPVEEMWAEILEGYKLDGLEDVIKLVNEEADKLGY